MNLLSFKLRKILSRNTIYTKFYDNFYKVSSYKEHFYFIVLFKSPGSQFDFDFDLNI